MEGKEHLENLSYIRSLMENSTRFISLSGLSGIAAGFWALCGAGLVYYLSDGGFDGIPWTPEYNVMYVELGIASAVLFLALASGFFFTARKTRKAGQKFWSKAAWRLMINVAIPLITGGLFCLILMYHGQWQLVGPCTLIFYGLALLNGGKYTITEIRKLGLLEIALGLASALMLQYTLLFWAFGFGVLHIAYGLFMYMKYDR